MSGEVNVGWNRDTGTAEAVASGSLWVPDVDIDVLYGIRIDYSVGKLQRNNDDLAELLDSPEELVINAGTMGADDQNRSRYKPYSDSYTVTWFDPGRRYRVEAKVEVTAQYAEHNNQDSLNVSDSDTMTAPEN